MRVLVTVLTSFALSAGCTSSRSPTQPSPTTSMMEVTPPPAPATARYRVVFESTWDAGSHPTDFPANAHYSPLVGATHGPAATFWQEGALATEGMRRMAERGAVSPLDSEVSQAIAAGTAQHLLSGPALGASPGSVSMEFDVSMGFPLVTLVTMVAPSPDWFAGVSGLALVENGAWRESVDAVLYPYDAGTDSGATYSAPDHETLPRRPITRLDGYPVATGGGTAPFGRFRFTRLP